MMADARDQDPTGDILIQEVDEDLRREQYLKLWKRYGVYAIAGVVAVVVIVAGWQGWQGWQRDQRDKAAQHYAAALALVEAGKTKDAEDALAKIAADQRTNACANPEAMFHGQPITVDDVLASRMIADPLHLLEIVMPVTGGAAFIVARKDIERTNSHRPAVIKGFGEYIQCKSPSYADDMLLTPIGPASRRAFQMAGRTPADMDMAEVYDCYTITVMLTLEDAGFCEKGAGAKFLRDHDLTYLGDFPLNTHGGQLSFGQAGMAGGMSQLVEAVRQIQGRCGERQLRRHDLAYVSGTGGVMSEQGALVLEGLQ